MKMQCIIINIFIKRSAALPQRILCTLVKMMTIPGDHLVWERGKFLESESFSYSFWLVHEADKFEEHLHLFKNAVCQASVSLIFDNCLQCFATGYLIG